MLLKPLTIAAAGLAAAATAFVVPPLDMESAGDEVTTLPFSMPQAAESQTVKLDCPDCPTVQKFAPGILLVDNHLELAFHVDHQPKYDRLLVNDFELYPNLDPFSSQLTAPQVVDISHSKKSKHEHRVSNAPKPPMHAEPTLSQLGFTIAQRVQPVAKEEQVDNMELIAIDLQIIEVRDTFVNGIPNVRIKLIKTADGALMIGDIQVSEAETSQFSPLDKQEECTTLLCKWKAIISQHMKHHHGCGKAGKAGGAMGHHHKGKGPHHASHHHHKGHPNQPELELHEHSWSQLFKKFGSHILSPVLVGILAGVSVSLIGMLFGSLIVGLWRLFVRREPFWRARVHQRRRHCSHSHHRSVQREAAMAEEKSELMANADLPPAYDEQADAKN